MAERAAADAPYAISQVDQATLRQAGPLINLSEAMARVPGLVVASRNNYAQDLQISSRGFGARAAFGVRGMRLYTDGIPASGPDGQGQVSHFDLAGAERVEVLRGPYSVLYGNSSGGVIALYSAPVRRNEVEAEADIGSFGLRQARVGGAAVLGGGFTLRAGASHMEIEGFRPHSAAQRDLASVRLGWQGDSDRVTVLLNHLDMPAQDPLGLTAEQMAADPYQTQGLALEWNTRKTLQQTQLGANWLHRFGDGALRSAQVSAYAGRRSVVGYLAIPQATQANRNHGGGVVDFDRDYAGADARLLLALGPVDLQVGAAVDRQRDDRRGWENFVVDGSTVTKGVIGKLRRDEDNEARSNDVFVQGEWTLMPGVVASAGARSGRVTLSATDRYLSNGDDSGRLTFDYTNPVLGLRWTALPGLNLHASVARGYESPTLSELAYRPPGTGGGLNDAVKAQTSRQAEVGAKWRGAQAGVDLSLFQTRVADEIGVATNAGGRSAFQNVGRTVRRGAELAVQWRPAASWQMMLSATWLDATYRDNFQTCGAPPCATKLNVQAGNRIAGTQRASAFAEAVWRGAAWGDWGLEVRGAARTAANDTNTAWAAGYGLVGLRWSKAYVLSSGLKLELLARLDNVADRVYAGSVIVNEANSRYFETGAPRNAMLAVRLVGL